MSLTHSVIYSEMYLKVTFRVTSTTFFVLAMSVISCGFQSSQRMVNEENVVDPLSGGIALGGMIHGLLDMQIRPQGGFYEKKYEQIFKSDSTTPKPGILKPFSWKYLPLVSTDQGTLSEDGRLLHAASMGLGESPCFDATRLQKNKLLVLLCSIHSKQILTQYSDGMQ